MKSFTTIHIVVVVAMLPMAAMVNANRDLLQASSTSLTGSTGLTAVRR